MRDGRLEFTFHQCLGKGGFGEVYLATVTRPGGLQRKAAVKVLKENLQREDEAVQRLQDEGRMLATLDHPSILRAQELTRIKGRIALIMEYVEGVDLSRCAKPGRLLPPRVISQAIAKVADALDCALNTPSPETGRPLNLIHRDIKPENIRLSVHGQVKLLDFGIARTTEMHRNAHTQVGDLPFTPGYAAPEAFTQGVQGPPSDIYALGVTTYRLVVGERLYEGMDLGSQVATAAMPDRYGPFLDKRLAKVENEPISGLIRKMLAYEAGSRPTALEIRELAEGIGDDLAGPTLVRWARSVTFPPPRSVKDASLTGETVQEDTAGLTAPMPKPRRPVVAEQPAPEPELKPPLWAADKKSVPPPVPRGLSSLSASPSLGAAPDAMAPPVPAGLEGSAVKPQTMPFVRPTPGAAGGRLQPVAPSGTGGSLAQLKTVIAGDDDESVPPPGGAVPIRAPTHASAGAAVSAIDPSDDSLGFDTTIVRGEKAPAGRRNSFSSLLNLMIVGLIALVLLLAVVVVGLGIYLVLF